MSWQDTKHYFCTYST